MSSDLRNARKPNWPANFTQRGTMFYASVRVPESLRGVITKGRQTHIRKSLRTAKEAEALRRLPLVVAEIKAQIEAARRDETGALKEGRPPKETVNHDAAWWRDFLRSRGTDPAEAMSDWEFSETVDRVLGPPVGTEWRGDKERPVYDADRERTATTLVELVRGDRVPVSAELERYISSQAHSSRYLSRIRRAVGGLEKWLEQRRKDHVAAVTRYEAGLYVEHLSATCNTMQTASSLITGLSTYWRWMVKRGIARENPWTDQAPDTRSSPNDAQKRPYSDDEVKQLLSGETYETLHDLMRIAALSGMRINEIGRLTVADCAGGLFDIREAKTSAGVRRVPIHPALAPIIARRSEGKGQNLFLFDELKARPDHTGDRAAKASERFTEYRRSLGIDERTEGQRQSNVDFHSFRRWFITKAEESGQPPHIISAVVGHMEGRQGMTLGVYSGGPSEQQMRAVVESVQLPRGTPAEKTNRPRMGQGRWPAGKPKSMAKN